MCMRCSQHVSVGCAEVLDAQTLIGLESWVRGALLFPVSLYFSVSF